MGQAKDARLTPEIAQPVCERTASAAVLQGSIAALGSQHVLGLRARSCSTGGTLAQEQVQAARREDVLNALSQIARRVRTRLGESLATVEEHSTPLVEATTPSLNALKAYSTGLKASLTCGKSAIAPLRRALEIDPNFAMVYAHFGLVYSTVGESVLSAESTRKAWHRLARNMPGCTNHKFSLRLHVPFHFLRFATATAIALRGFTVFEEAGLPPGTQPGRAAACRIHAVSCASSNQSFSRMSR
jgi:hypothetical protein